MSDQDTASILEDLLGSELAQRKASQGGLKADEKKAIRRAIECLLERNS